MFYIKNLENKLRIRGLSVSTKRRTTCVKMKQRTLSR